jgi:hypothetical protein
MAEFIFAGLVIGVQTERLRPHLPSSLPPAGTRAFRPCASPGVIDGVMCAQVGWAWRSWPTTRTQSASKSRQRCRQRCSRYCARALFSAPRCLACVYGVERGELAAPPEAGGLKRLVTAQYRWQPHSGAKCPMRPRNVDETVQAIILATDPDEKDFRTLPNSL